MKEAGEGLQLREKGWVQATDKDDQLGVIMKFLRAPGNQATSEISVCLLRYPLIAEFVDNPYALDGNLTVSLKKMKDHAFELARAAALEHFQQGQDLQEEQEDWRKDRKRKKGSRLLYRLAPGILPPLELSSISVGA